jgi:hypothetical protein
MTDKKPSPQTEVAPVPDGTVSAETKRRAARRRFLRQGGAAGSGLLIVTLSHQRAFAGSKKTVYTSTAETCYSIGGTLPAGKKNPVKKKVEDSVNPGKKVERWVYECEVDVQKHK